MESMMTLGLRVDVDTYRGTRDGVPSLLAVFARYGIHASFFFSAGPDNMGRHLWRLLRPAFLIKMLRSNAPGLYGWDILLRGTLWPGPQIGTRCADVIKATDAAGHEVGLHAWDHHAWQMGLGRMDADRVGTELRRGVERLTEILGHPPTCSAVPGWKCNSTVLAEKTGFPFEYNSDCRGHGIFTPDLAGRMPAQPQVPTTLPTYDEVIGRNGITDDNYNEYILSLIEPGQLNVLTIHAEVEGIARIHLFERFLDLLAYKGIACVPLGALVRAAGPVPAGTIVPSVIPGREGWVAVQA